MSWEWFAFLPEIGGGQVGLLVRPHHNASLFPTARGLALKWRSKPWGELRKKETDLGLAGAILEDNLDNCSLSIRKQSYKSLLVE